MSDELASLGVIFTEFYYWVTIVFMFLIHVGFSLYEVGVSRRKNHMHTLMNHARFTCSAGGSISESRMAPALRAVLVLPPGPYLGVS